MVDREFSSYQRKAIKRFYDNRDDLDDQRLSDLVGNLYLAEGKKKAKLWETAREIMERLGVPQTRIEHVCVTGDPSILAEVVKDLQSGKIRKPKPKPPEGEAPQRNAS